MTHPLLPVGLLTSFGALRPRGFVGRDLPGEPETRVFVAGPDGQVRAVLGGETAVASDAGQEWLQTRDGEPSDVTVAYTEDGEVLDCRRLAKGELSTAADRDCHARHPGGAACRLMVGHGRRGHPLHFHHEVGTWSDDECQRTA